MLYIAEQNRVLQYPAAAFLYESADVVAVPIVPQGELIPPADESYRGHWRGTGEDTDAHRATTT